MAPVVASSPRLTLQVFSVPDHFEAYYELEMDPEVTKWSSNPPFKDKEEVLQKLNNRRPTPEKPWSQTWAICLKPEDPDVDEGSGKFVGAIGLPREIDVGYRISRAYWGKGFMTEALVMFVDMFWKLDDYAKYNRISAHADSENGASMRVMEKAGFKKGEYKKAFYERGAVPGVKLDLQEFYIERPTS